MENKHNTLESLYLNFGVYFCQLVKLVRINSDKDKIEETIFNGYAFGTLDYFNAEVNHLEADGDILVIGIVM